MQARRPCGLGGAFTHSLSAHPHQRVDRADAIGQDEQRVDLDLHDVVVLESNIQR